MNYYINRDNLNIYVRREFGHYEHTELFSIEEVTHHISILTNLADFEEEELTTLHSLIGQHFEANKEVCQEVEDEIIFRHHAIEYKIPVLRCRNGVWSYEMLGDVK